MIFHHLPILSKESGNNNRNKKRKTVSLPQNYRATEFYNSKNWKIGNDVIIEDIFEKSSPKLRKNNHII